MEQKAVSEQGSLIDQESWTLAEIQERDALEFVLPEQRVTLVEFPQFNGESIDAFTELHKLLLCIAGRCENCFTVLDASAQILVEGVTDGTITVASAISSLRAKLQEKSRCAACKTVNCAM